MKIKISHDVYNISNRIKDIDRDYYVVYDTDRRRFEVHNSCQLGSTYCLSLPYDSLDYRTLIYVLKTRIDNIEELINSIDMENKLLDNQSKSESIDLIGEYLEEEMRK